MSRPTLSIPASDEPVLLAIEDDVPAELLAHRMTRRGLHPVRAEHGGEARRHLQSTAFSLVVIESRLPGLTGLELLRGMPAEDNFGEPSIVLLGQQGNNEQIVRAFELGAAEYIQRPFAPEVALARIVRFLKGENRLVSRSPSAASLLLVPGWNEPAVGTLPFQLMIGATMGLVVLAMLFALIAFSVHVYTKHRDDRRQDLVSHWKGRLMEVLAEDAPPQALIDEIDPARERQFLTFLVPYAVMTTGRSQELLTRLATPFVLRFEEDLASRRAGHRARALQHFGLLGDASCRGLLRRHLNDSAPLVRYTAFRWLARRGIPQDTELLLRHLDRLSNVAVNQLSSALVHLGEAAAPVLRSYLQDEAQTTFVRVVCAETLRWMGDGEGAPIAVQLLACEPPSELAAALLRLIRRIGRPEHAPLVRSYCTGEESFVSIHAARALGQIGDPDHDRKLLRRLVINTDSRWIALNAAKSLTELGQTTPLHHISHSSHERASLAKSVLEESQ